MDILASIIADLPDRVPVSEVRIGPFWTAVISNHCGLASTTLGFQRNITVRAPVEEAGFLREKSAVELCRYVHRESFLERSIGLAAINSLLAVPSDNLQEINGADILSNLGADKSVCIVGHFPFINKLRQQVKQLWVLELNPQPGDLPAHEASRIIPRADIVAITSTALINGTMEGLLELCRKDAITLVLGPTTPLSPKWFDLGVDLVSGTVVTEPDIVLQLISEGATFRQFKGRGVKTVTMTSPEFSLKVKQQSISLEK